MVVKLLARYEDLLPFFADFEGIAWPEYLGFMARPSVELVSPSDPDLLLDLCYELDPSGLYILLAGGLPNCFE